MTQLYPIHHANTYYHNYIGLYSQDYDWIASLSQHTLFVQHVNCIAHYA